ncbi:hypothetical protein EGW08_023459 [Elysia chlorotica]|uniref:G-protein coupled receptors family 1 profile domain-containing protein n=1 Tax=Elysia chlorotica TaxID=188477 RepID=A0A3S1AUP6_ELYCH|nr:hypothetical protein EGW08_023459 [Elysia chlorotica]
MSTALFLTILQIVFTKVISALSPSSRTQLSASDLFLNTFSSDIIFSSSTSTYLVQLMYFADKAFRTSGGFMLSYVCHIPVNHRVNSEFMNYAIIGDPFSSVFVVNHR